MRKKSCSRAYKYTYLNASAAGKRAAGTLAVLLLTVMLALSFGMPQSAYASPEDNSEGNVPELTGVQGGAFEVTDYIFRAEVGKDHSYTVEEVIKVNIPDQLPSIEFSIPSGSFRISDITVENTAYAAKKASEASTVSIVDAEKLTEGSHEYTIRYRIQEYQDQDDSKDMFYFKVLLPEWKQPIGSVDIEVTFPEDFPWDDMQCYAGQFGVQDTSNRITFKSSESKHKVTVTGKLIPENFGITLKAQLPDGYWEDALDGSWAFAAAMSSIAGAVLILLALWFIGGRDPKVEKEAVTRPIEGFNPVELGYAFNSEVGIRDILHMILYFAQRGYIRISEYEPKRYRLYKRRDPAGEEKMFRNAYSILFEGVYKGRAIDMKDLGPRLDLVMRSITDDVAAGFASAEASAFTPISRAFRFAGAAVLGAGLGLCNAFSYVYTYQSANIFESITAGALASAASLLLCRNIDTRDSSEIGAGRLAEIWSGLLTAAPAIYVSVRTARNTGNLPAGAAVFIAAALGVFLIVIMRARGKENARLVGKIRQLRNFIYHPTPKELLENHLADPSYYYDMMIYAMAFGAEESWAISFLTLDVPEPDWYTDDIEGHAFTNLREELTTIDYARDVRSFVRTLETAYDEMHRRNS